MKKKILFMLSLLFCFCLLFTVSAEGEEEYVCGDFTYTVLRDGTAKITGYDRSKIDLIVPEELDGHQVTVIGQNTFSVSDLKTIQLPDSLRAIEENAFYCTEFLTEIIIPEGVTVIGPGAFCMSGLKSIVLPYSLRIIEDGAFAECRYLRDAVIHEGVKVIGVSAFANNWGLRELVIPESVELIGETAFFDCKNLRHVTVKSKDTVIKSGAFSDLFRLQMSVEPGSQAEGYCVAENVDYVYPDQVSWLPGEYSFGDYTYSLFKDGTAEITGYQGESTDLVIPEALDGITVSSIGRCAFNDNQFDLTSVKIPGSIISIEARAFLCCYELESVELSEGLKEIKESAFEDCEKLKQIVLPSGLQLGTKHSAVAASPVW